MHKWLLGLVGFLTILYPFVVYFGIQFIEPWGIAVALLSLLLIKFFHVSENKQWNQWLLVAGIVFCGLAVWNNNLITLRFYPVLVNVGLFLLFFISLFSSQPIIERLARIQHPHLPEQGIRYTRKVTVIWSVFFVINGLLATYTAVWCSFAIWSLYNGFIAYLLMGLLMGVEYLVRIKTQEHVR